MVKANIIHNWPITPKYTRKKDNIFGPVIGALKGETVQRNPKPVKLDTVHIPPEFKLINRKATLTVYIMLMNNITFFIVVSRKNKFTTVEQLTIKPDKTVVVRIKRY